MPITSPLPATRVVVLNTAATESSGNCNGKKPLHGHFGIIYLFIHLLIFGGNVNASMTSRSSSSSSSCCFCSCSRSSSSSNSGSSSSSSSLICKKKSAAWMYVFYMGNIWVYVITRVRPSARFAWQKNLHGGHYEQTCFSCNQVYC